MKTKSRSLIAWWHGKQFFISDSGPEGTIIARIAWRYVPSEENNKIFGREQSFVPGEQPPWYLQFMVKDSKKYGATGGRGYEQIDKDGKPALTAQAAFSMTAATASGCDTYIA